MTVFLQGAQIERRATVELRAGTNEVIFTGLSSRIEPGSIQVGGDEGITIISVEHSLRSDLAPQSEALKSKKDSLEDVEFRLSLRNSLQKVYQEERSMILENKNIKGEQTGVDIEDLMELAIYYRKRLKEIEYKLIEVRNDIEELSQQRSGLQKRIQELEQERLKKQGTVAVRLQAENDKNSPITLRYLVHGAGWTPSYDIRSKEIRGPIELSYKGNIRQQTGTDWKDVDLTLSSGEPVRSGDQPHLSPWYLRSATVMKRDQKNHGSASNARPQVRPMMERQEKAPEPLSGPSSKVRQDNISTSFHIDMPYTIPADGKGHAVEILRHELPVLYRYFVAPKADPDAFLLANVTGWEDLELLPGKAAIYYQGTYVGRSHLDPDITEDTLSISLGRDQGVAVERKRVRDKTETSIIGGKKKVSIRVRIDVRNNKQEKVRLLVRDQIPLSRQADIEVEPTDQGGASLNAETGALSWDIELGPGKNRSLEFTFTVRYPKEMNLSGL